MKIISNIHAFLLSHLGNINFICMEFYTFINKAPHDIPQKYCAFICKEANKC